MEFADIREFTTWMKEVNRERDQKLVAKKEPLNSEEIKSLFCRIHLQLCRTKDFKELNKKVTIEKHYHQQARIFCRDIKILTLIAVSLSLFLCVVLYKKFNIHCPKTAYYLARLSGFYFIISSFGFIFLKWKTYSEFSRPFKELSPMDQLCVKNRIFTLYNVALLKDATLHAQIQPARIL